MATFTVDTHLFRELGELLVGRDSTALIELIKNAYDADATEVIVYGEALSSPSRGFIRIRDNGIGMSENEFTTGFLRIASRSKETSTRRSPVHQRRYTGAKGVGRLAAHKLARLLTIESIRWDGSRPLSSGELKGAFHGIEATIDWDAVEEKATLDELDGTNAIVLRRITAGSSARAGTTITLARLRKRWTETSHARFLEEVQAYAPPEKLVEPIPPSVLPESLLFDEPRIRDVRDSSNALSVILEGELAPPDDYWTALLSAANWVIEIDANKSTGKVRYLSIGIGAVTGDSSYFLLSESARLQHELPTASLRPALSRARHLTSPSIDAKIWADFRKRDDRVWLFSPPQSLLSHPAVSRYLRWGERSGCKIENNKIRSRELWYRVPLPKSIDAYVSGMSSTGPLICFKSMHNLTATNTLYTVGFLQHLDPNDRAAVALALLTTQCAEELSQRARNYAAGLSKFEPSDLLSVKIPTVENRAGAWLDYQRIAGLALEGRRDSARLEADKWFFARR